MQINTTTFFLISYLKRKKLCGRTAVQSFIDEDEDKVKQVCGTSGNQVVPQPGRSGNLCISKKKMRVYDVYSTKCSRINSKMKIRKVVLACDKVGNRCLPVHYQKPEALEASDQDCS